MADLLELTPDERLDLIGELWDTLAETPKVIPLTEPQQLELEARLDAHRASPDAGDSWENVKARVLGR